MEKFFKVSMYRHVKMSAIESDLHFQDPKLAFLLGIKFLVTKSQFTIIAYTTSWLQFGTLTIEMSLVYHNYVYGKHISLFHPDFIVKILHTVLYTFSKELARRIC